MVSGKGAATTHRMPLARIGKAERLAAGAIIAAGVLLAACWATYLPFFQSPDEDSHYDYALTLYTAGRPLHASENVVGRDTHPVVEYLMEATNARALRLDTDVRAGEGYGTRSFYRAVDRGAPLVSREAFHDGPIDPVPYVARLYPAGYYWLAAGAIWAAGVVSPGSAVAQYLFARYLSVLLLIPTLLFSWLTLREAGLSPRKALLFLAATALFPLTGWVAGSVQPDNLAAALIAPSLWLALRLRDQPRNLRLFFALGLVLAALMATKRHYFVAVFLPIALILAARVTPSWEKHAPRALLLLIVPAAIAFVVTGWMLHAEPGGSGVCTSPNGFLSAMAGGPSAVGPYLMTGVEKAAGYTFLPSAGFYSFWLSFTAYATTPILIVNHDFTIAVAAFLALFTVVLSALFLIRIAQNLRRLSAVARRRSFGCAARVATSNVLINSYLTFFAVLWLFELYVRGDVAIQGRYWWPYLTVVWMISADIAPKALPKPIASAASNTILGAILAFCILGSAYAFPTIERRFYAAAPTHDASDEIYARFSSGDGLAQSVRLGLAPYSAPLRVTGVVFDRRLAREADSVLVVVDGRSHPAVRRQARPDIVCDSERTLMNTGFESDIDTAQLPPGEHQVALFVKVPWNPRVIDTGARASFRTGR